MAISRTFAETALIMITSRKQLKGSSTRGWTNELWSTHIMQYYRRGSLNFFFGPIKGQIVNSLGFVGYTVCFNYSTLLNGHVYVQ